MGLSGWNRMIGYVKNKLDNIWRYRIVAKLAFIMNFSEETDIIL
jgi:hypothetical protein